MKINPEDILVSTEKPSDANYADSGVRIYHKPTGFEVVVTEFRSQHKNRNKALELLE